MTPTIAIITAIMILVSLITGLVIARKYKNLIISVLAMLGGTAVSIAAAVVFSNYEPAAAPDSAASDADPSALDSIRMLFTEAFTVLAAITSVLLLACVFGAAMHFAKDPLER